MCLQVYVVFASICFVVQFDRMHIWTWICLEWEELILHPKEDNRGCVDSQEEKIKVQDAKKTMPKWRHVKKGGEPASLWAPAHMCGHWSYRWGSGCSKGAKTTLYKKCTDTWYVPDTAFTEHRGMKALAMARQVHRPQVQISGACQ